MASAKDKQSIREWDEYVKALRTDTALEADKSKADIEKHRQSLERDPVAWMKYMFPNYATADFAPFHKRFIKRAIENAEWYEVISWARELAKDTVVMMTMMYLNLTGKKKFTIFVSSSYDAACDLLMPYMLNFEGNSRIIAYYGEQKKWGSWENGNFTTKCGARYVAIGAGQSPRGKKNEALRPDSIILTDLDTDEDTRNKDTIDKRWDWVEKALIPTRSVSKPLLTLVLGNIIAKDCCVTRAGKMADHWDIVNIRDKDGKSSWPAKNTEEMIDRVLSKISTKAAQGEYFNNPLSEGDIFKEETWGKCPPLSKLPFALVYADPSPSNKDKQKKGTSFKSAWLMGYKDGVFYVYKGFLEQTGTDTFVNWFYDLRDWSDGKALLYNYIENNSLQDPFYEQVIQPKFLELGKTKGYVNITPDTRRKPDKPVRIEGTLEPLWRTGQLVFNIDEKGNPHMMRLVEQFKLFTMQMKAPGDGPDCIEGGVWILNQKIRVATPSDFKTFSKQTNSKRI
jgi:hypothetical protein